MTLPRTLALDAAIDLVGTQGLRALTHVRVDETAGLPRGSTSNYFRTRRALLSGVVDRVVEREMPEVGTAFSPASGSDLVDALCRLFDYTTRDNRVLTTARYVLFLEASHHTDLQQAVSRGRAALENLITPAVGRLGAQDPPAATSAIMACFEGLILHDIARNDRTDPRPTFDLLVRAALD